MQGSWLDTLPSGDREKLRRRLRSPEAYEALREKVKGPEDLANELKKAEQMAELHFTLVVEPGVREALRLQVQEDIGEKGIDAVLDAVSLSQEGRGRIQQGQFDVRVDAHPQTQEDALVAVPEGNVQEKVPGKTSFSDRYVGQFLKKND